MKQNFTFVFVLLAMLSMVNAIPFLHKRETRFGSCPPPIVAPVPNVTITPDPMVPGNTVDVTITAKLNTAVAKGSGDKIDAVFFDSGHNIIGKLLLAQLCTAKGVKCPIPPGTEFSATLEKVPVPDAKFLGKGATFFVGIVDEEFNHLACAISTSIS